jgi:hypothetical protein
MSNQTIAVTIVNHVAVDIACAPDVVWRAILEEYVEARKFREIGYAIEPLDDPAAFLGGYRMQLEQGGSVVDSRDCLITEFDESARRLSIVARYLAAPNGMTVHVSYHAKAVGDGTCYAIDCHSDLGIEQPAGVGRDPVRVAVTEMTSQFDAALGGYLQDIKAKLGGPA